MSASGNKQPILQVEDLAVAYGHIEAVKGISLSLNEGEITALVGANGAGKSTSLLAISGLVKAQRGRVLLNGQDLLQMSPHRIVESGVVQVAEGRATLTTLTVEENLALGAYTRKDKDGVARDLEWVYSLFPVLKNRAAGLAGNLSGGEQQMLAIGRGLMSEPALLIMDEPSLGLSPLLVEQMFELIAKINKEGMPILLMEQNAVQTLAIAHRAYIIENGVVAMQGTAAEMARDPELRKNYLGL
jgi:branched-chain amino acid transport system ATP-binding protein